MVSRGGVFERWLGNEGGTLINEISALQKRPQRAPLPLPACDGTVRRWLSMNQEVLMRWRIHWHLDLGCPSFQNCEKYISVAYKPHSLWYSVIAAQTHQDRRCLEGTLAVLGLAFSLQEIQPLVAEQKWWNSENASETFIYMSRGLRKVFTTLQTHIPLFS